ncbi:MAG: HRDC domain-containing protein [Dysgonamonadaceae bacterium]|jgi:superfamily II DNA helicase RecQ|nr:HRDC domain-containing protein [Dysgonamonadaceae bacterium]
MQFKHYTISVFDTEAEEEMNTFLRSHKIVDFERRLLETPRNTSWIYCIQYIAGNTGGSTFAAAGSFAKKDRIDYKTVLDEPQFARFERYRTVRRSLADKENQPAYTIFNDAELAEIAKLEELTESNVRSLGKVINEKRLSKNAKVFCEAVNTAAESQPVAAKAPSAAEGDEPSLQMG